MLFRSAVRSAATHSSKPGLNSHGWRAAKSSCIAPPYSMMERAGERLEDADFACAFRDMSGTGSKVTARLLGAEGLGFIAT